MASKLQAILNDSTPPEQAWGVELCDGQLVCYEVTYHTNGDITYIMPAELAYTDGLMYFPSLPMVDYSEG